MTRDDLAHARLMNQQIAHPTSKEPSQVVADFGAMQAQDYASALWAIGLRLPNAAEMSIEQAIADGAIIRTWPMRGTLHFVAAADVRWMLQLLTPRILARRARRRQQLDLDDATLARSRDLFIQALQGNRLLTRAALLDLLEAAGISTAAQRGYHILSHLALTGLICLGPRAGKQDTFALLQEWCPRAQEMDRDEALAELAERYFTGHGPATLHDFVWWSGLSVADARAGLAMVSTQLERRALDDQTYWMSQATAAAVKTSPSVYLLPSFDEYIIGYRDRSAVLNPMHAQKITPGSNGVFRPIVVIDGHIVGTWKRTLRKNTVDIVPSPFAALSQAEERAFTVAAERYARFLGRSVKQG